MITKLKLHEIFLSISLSMSSNGLNFSSIQTLHPIPYLIQCDAAPLKWPAMLLLFYRLVAENTFAHTLEHGVLALFSPFLLYGYIKLDDHLALTRVKQVR